MKTLKTKAKLSQAKEARAYSKIINEIYNQVHSSNIPDDMNNSEALRHIEDVIGWMNAQARISKAKQARARS